MSAASAGTLYVVATPIGNLQDITRRALEVLKQVDWIAAEDTRHTRQLLAHYGISRPLISLHEHNEASRAEQLLVRLQNGECGALVSDAGTPLISDPGATLVRRLRDAGIHVRAVPGPSALIAALSIAGLPTDRFAFEGFLPPKAGARQRVLESLKGMAHTLVFYEAPHRLLASLEAMQAVWGADHAAVVVRELTKRFESVQGETLGEVLAYFAAHPDEVRGECVILLGPDEPRSASPALDPAVVLGDLLEKGISAKVAAQLASRWLGLRRNAAYKLAQSLKKA
ncbi:16S rRNA (cytidine1402-2'-O)-methyltransferase [Sulfurivirga caldicuralii]|uniref:Ribosomal RNA small subunit methyltransferase I n=1 Tax=Sulfurivirga caldicuralii TaxID=364032 RepID=A0A1N6DUY6_9GAMM|nr:16S rRNA (cytidine(1402)-2'-O)-methyltransferase [Sulfurivirga caldicuralii]SIN74605.1 16S rRNA (cytidine1402-2'-O)-methyltransferase [Sulfurivirga caldicuralii]